MTANEEKNGAHILNQDTTRSNKKMIALIEKKYESTVIEDILLLDCNCRLDDIQKKIKPLQKEEVQLLLLG